MATQTHYRMELNNVLQQRDGSTSALTWEAFSTGPLHDPTWTYIAYIKGVEYGRGQGRGKDIAKELAAQRALIALRG
ncbi:hypothetical protein SERLA73DRAFT_129097 [Serpula lacrymans var. lacrymans S7.3]|uniref:DRBM domain-containing protein n=2 Tax=Serpula lacrymans var. lacrymans TaxID=341189 RepID=F8PF59_SERL3|nr:uncharacterized protein SERLADRAFT_376765 [Serpula lacrymans var. lacrymans S7.9]EGO05251.1 hypothetical protein SERLA73DRAFT_129097 [Serpula lacrymans var. lacrymans S7.3]EGO31105.1 hypothetical protein SERLADRAFT_376765 [Serpula lacrymans var. lacrymans S7.9]